MRLAELGRLPACRRIAACLLVAGAPVVGQTFELSSATLRHGQRMPAAQVHSAHGCAGANLSPPLRWRDAPAGTKSFAVTMYDPDAPTGSGWWHWIAYDIPASVAELPEGAGAAQAGPAGAPVHAINDFGVAGYGGACPPPGSRVHRYVIAVHALGVPALPLPPLAPPALVRFMIHQHRIGHAGLMLIYGR